MRNSSLSDSSNQLMSKFHLSQGKLQQPQIIKLCWSTTAIHTTNNKHKTNDLLVNIVSGNCISCRYNDICSYFCKSLTTDISWPLMNITCTWFICASIWSNSGWVSIAKQCARDGWFCLPPRAHKQLPGDIIWKTPSLAKEIALEPGVSP